MESVPSDSVTDEEPSRVDKSQEPNPQCTKHHVTGRRGPGIHRHTTETDSMGLVASQPLHARRTMKPSLTPGLGTRRTVNKPMCSETRPKSFCMEASTEVEAFNEWHEAVRRMAHLGDGLPNFVRRRVWSTLADRQLLKQHVDWAHVVRVAFDGDTARGQGSEEEHSSSQIAKDLHRTGCDQFGSDADRAALERVLRAYARWNKRVGYCQGFNVIAAAILDVTGRDEKEAFKIMVYLIDYVLPESYFAQNLQALSVDIAVFRQLLKSRLPKLSLHLDRLQYKAAIDANSRLGHPIVKASEFLAGRAKGLYEPPLLNVYTIQWFLTLFATCLAPDAVLRIWDSILLEGSEVILRTAVVIMEFLASRLMKLKSADEFYTSMNNLMVEFAEGQIVSTRELVFEIYQLAPFPYPLIKELRESFLYNITPLVRAPPLAQTKKFTRHTGSLDQSAKSRGDGGVSGGSPINNKSDGTTDNNSKRGSWRFGVRWRRKKNTEMDDKKSGNSKSVADNLKDAIPDPASSNQKPLPVPESAKPPFEEPDDYQEINLFPEPTQLAHTQVTSSNVQMDSNHLFSQENSATQHVSHIVGDTCVLPTDPVINASPRRHANGSTPRYLSSLWPQKAVDRYLSTRQIRSDSSSIPIGDPICETTNRPSTGQDQSLKDAGRVISRLNRSHSLSPKHEANNTDLSKVGPGAVGVTPGPRPGCSLPLAHQARMSTDLNALKSVYRRQLAKQRRATLMVPDLWTTDVISLPTGTGGTLFNDTRVTAFMPQQREGKEMEFKPSLVIPSPDNGHVETSPSAPLNTHKSGVHSNGPPKSPRDSRTHDEHQSCHHKPAPITSNHIDPHLIGAVESWRTTAIWSSTPSLYESNEAKVGQIAVKQRHSPQVQRGSEANPSTPSASPTSGGRPTLFMLACSGKSRSADETNPTTPERTPSQHSMAYHSLHSSLGSDPGALRRPSTDSCPTTEDYLSPLRDDVFYRALVEHIAHQRTNKYKADLTNSTNKSSGSTRSQSTNPCSNDVEDSDSYYTSVSHTTQLKTAPWKDAVAACIEQRRRSTPRSNVSSVRQSNAASTRYQFPLSPKRRQFGEKFGIYKSLQVTPDKLLSTFSDRIQFVGILSQNTTTNSQGLDCAN